MAPRARDALDAVLAAARANDVETMDARLAMDDDRRGASLVDARDREGRRAMHHASALGCVDVVEALARRHGAEVDAEDDDGRGALTHAAANARDECVKFLIDTCDAWIDASDCNDDTALTAACRQGEASTVEILLARGADARARNADGCDAFAEALCVRGDVEMARLLIQSGVNPKRSRVRCGGDGANASRSASVTPWPRRCGSSTRRATISARTSGSETSPRMVSAIAASTERWVALSILSLCLIYLRLCYICGKGRSTVVD